MNVQLLIDSVVRQTTVLIAQLATAGVARAPLAHVATQVFADLASELEAQGLSRKVTADMFGISLRRSYQRKVHRARESRTEQGRSLWESVLDYLRVYSFVATRQRCELVPYSGCDATENNHETMQACWQACEADNFGGACLEAWEPLGRGELRTEERTEQYGAGGLPALLEGEHRADIVFPDNTVDALSLSLSDVRLYEAQRRDNRNYALQNVPPPCENALRVEASARFVTDGGGFDEHWPLLTFAIEDGTARASITLQSPVSSSSWGGEPLRGSYVPRVPAGRCVVQLVVAIEIAQDVFRGEVTSALGPPSCDAIGGGSGNGEDDGIPYWPLRREQPPCPGGSCCAELSVEQCLPQPECRPIEGLRADEDDACWEPRQVGCMPADGTCADEEVLARDATGAWWRFPSRCVPEGFVEQEMTSLPDFGLCFTAP